MGLYGLPYFCRKSKETTIGFKMRMQLIGCIVHGIGSYVFIMHKNWPADPNLTIEVIHRVLSFIKPTKGKHLFVQVLFI